MNKIPDRQNEDKAILYLATQRQLYNEAKYFNFVILLFSVVLPLLFAIFQSIITENANLSVISYILSITSMIISLCLSSSVSKKREDAAEIQQHFDIYVYQMPWDNKLFGKEKNLSDIVAEKSKSLIHSEEDKYKLQDWYTPAVGTVPLVQGILSCQKENFYWDVTLRKRFRKMSIISIVFLGIAIIGVGLVKDESIGTLLFRLAFIIPMIQWLCETVKQLNKDITTLTEIDILINSSDIKSMDALQEIQSKIYNHRKSCFIIPSKFYEKYKDNDEDTAHRIASMDR